jgi:hypothetical protein
MCTLRHLVSRRVRIRHKKRIFKASSCPLVFRSVRWTPPAWRISVKFDTRVFYEYLLINSIFDSNRTELSGTLHRALSRFYCCRPHKFATNVLFWSTLYFFHCWHWQAAQRYTEHVLRLHYNNGHTNMAQYHSVRTVPVLCWFLTTKYSHSLFLFIPSSYYLWR